MKPLAACLSCGGVMLAAIALSNPFQLAAALVAALALLAAAEPPRRLYLATALGAGLLVFAINPFVSAQGLTVLWQGPQIPVLDTQITVEELVYGAAAGVRLAATMVAVGAFVRLVDSDLLLRAVSRVAPRSAMIAAVASQMLPALERDAAGLTMAARTRAATLRSARTAGALLPALLTMSLERSLATAESMEARGYGGAGRSRRPERGLRRGEWAIGLLGAATIAVVTAAVATGAGSFRYYDLLADPVTGGAVSSAAAIAIAGLVAAGAARWLN